MRPMAWCAALLLALLGHGRASAADIAPWSGWYAGVRGGIVVTDQDYDNDGTNYAIDVGRRWREDYAFEISISRERLDFGIDYGLVHRTVEFNLVTINPEPLWHPYLLAGIGYIEFDAPAGQPIRHGGNALFNLGVGGTWELLPPGRVLARLDLRFRYDLNDTNQPGQAGFGDGLLTVGLVVPFGR